MASARLDTTVDLAIWAGVRGRSRGELRGDVGEDRQVVAPEVAPIAQQRRRVGVPGSHVGLPGAGDHLAHERRAEPTAMASAH